jgi:hypothetical protein
MGFVFKVIGYEKRRKNPDQADDDIIQWHSKNELTQNYHGTGQTVN